MREESKIVTTRRISPVPNQQALREILPVVAAALIAAILRLLA